MFGYMLTTKQMKATPPAGLTFLLYFSSSSSESWKFYFRISIRAGTHFSDLQEVEVIDLNEPTGWIVIPLKDAQEKLVLGLFHSGIVQI